MNEKRLLLYKYIFFDIIAALTVWILFTYFRQMVNDGKLFENVQIFIPKYNIISSILVFPILCLFINWLSGFYEHPTEHNKTFVLLTTFVSSIIISILIFFALLLDDIVVTYDFYYYALLVLIGLNFVIVSLFRLIIVVGVKRKFRNKIWTINTAIVGAGTNADRLASELKRSERHTFSGFILPKPSKAQSSETIGTMRDIASVIQQHSIEEVIIALDNPDDQQLFTIIDELFLHNVEIRFTPRLYEILTGSAKIENPKMSPLVNITRPSMPDWQSCVKRFTDIVLSLFALAILFIPIIIISIAIKKDSKGTIFYKQERIGKNGKPFDIIKFRTMISNSENGVPMLSSAEDSRITKVGHYLRKYRIDEVPQFWNVLKGEMSLVGPRPERAYFINEITNIAPYYCLLYKIRPGLTSWGPIRIGYSDTLEKMIERLNYDIIYMDNMSLFVDFKILIYTFEIIFKGKGV